MASNVTALRREILESEYSHLNEMQRQAVFAFGDPLLILAGAGSGKTTVIVNKIGYLIKYGNVYGSEYTDAADADDVEFLEACVNMPRLRKGPVYDKYMKCDPLSPSEILAITFTNKAAGEMRERIERNFGISADELWALTFHSLCVRILRKYASKLGFSSSFTIYDDSDSHKLLDTIIKPMELDERYSPKTAAAIISTAKGEFLDPEEFAHSHHAKYLPKMTAIYEQYQYQLKQANAFDFDDLIFYTVELLETFPEIRNAVRRKFKYILVDEYQDTNPLQNRLVSLLVTNGRICVVGDDDQSIYRFMGATVENILDFENQYENTKVVRLEQNYRSTSTILDAANAVIGNNVARKGKNLWTDSGKGDVIRYNCLRTHYEEADYIAKSILADSSTKNLRFSDFCVLYRTHSISNQIELALKGNGIPYRIYGGVAFLKRKEIQDALAYLNVIINPNDKIRLLRIINEPKRAIGAATVEAVSEIAARTGKGFFDVMTEAYSEPSLSRAAEKLTGFTSIIRELQKKSEVLSLAELYTEALRLTGYSEMIEKLDRTEREARLDNLQELQNMIVNYQEKAETPSLSGFLEETALIGATDELDENDDAVVLMTMHCAKGLEFNTVFVSGFEEGIFPSQKSALEEGGI